MKNQFMHKPSQDGSNDPKNINQTSNLDDDDIDPLSHRQLPRLASAQPPISHAPTVNPVPMPAAEAPTMHQPATPDRPSYQSPPQNRGGTYPPGIYNNPHVVPPPTSNHGFPGSNPVSSHGFPGPNPASNHGFPGPAQAPNAPGTRITRDLSNLGQYPGVMAPGNQGPPYGYGNSTGQPGNPNPMSNAGFNNVPPGFAPPQSMLQKPRGPKWKKHIPIWARVVIGFVAFLVITGGGAFAYYQFTFGKSVNDIVGNSATHSIDGKTQTINTTNTDPLTTRTNIMLLGSDTDGKSPGDGGNDPTTGQPLAQTVIIVTIDPKTNYVGMLSIPRDMQVTDSVTGFANEKLDEAFEHAWVGNTNKDKAAAAAGHMEDIIQQNYGIHIDHYAWVGLQGFTKVITDINGVDIDVAHPMFDDDYPDDSGSGSKYGYVRVNIAPGPQHLTGPQALTYVRTRHADLGGDFGRTDRQQQVLSQIKEKLTQNNTITQASSILKDLDGFLFTDFSLSQLATFADVAKSVDINKVDHVSFTNNYSTAAPAPSTNVLPECAAINAEIQKMFGTPGTCQTQYASTLPQTGTSIASTQPSTTTASMSNQTSSNMTMAPASQSTIGDTSTFSNLMNLMLLSVSGSFNAMQG